MQIHVGVKATRAFLIIVFITFSTLALVSCDTSSNRQTTPHPATIAPTKQNPEADWPDRWLQSIPCKPPCWEGIIPGQTTASEAVKLLNASPIVFQAEMTTTIHPSDHGFVLWLWFNGAHGGEAYYHALADNPTIYMIAPYFPKHFSLRSVVQSYGDPSDILARAYHNPDGSLSSDVSIFYRSLGIVLVDASPGKHDISFDMTFEHVSFFAQTDEGLKIALGGSADHPEWLTPWKGIKDFEFYCKDLEGGKACNG